MCCAGRLLTALRGDQDIVNCVAAHPTQPLLASCGFHSGFHSRVGVGLQLGLDACTVQGGC